MPIAFDTGFRDIQLPSCGPIPIAIVPGLGQPVLHRMAYNHSVYLYDALLDVIDLVGALVPRIATGLAAAWSTWRTRFALRSRFQAYHARRIQEVALGLRLFGSW